MACSVSFPRNRAGLVGYLKAVLSMAGGLWLDQKLLQVSTQTHGSNVLGTPVEDLTYLFWGYPGFGSRTVSLVHSMRCLRLVGSAPSCFSGQFRALRWALLWVQVFQHLGLRTFLAVQALTAFLVGVSSPSNIKVLPKDGTLESLQTVVVVCVARAGRRGAA